MMKFYSHCRLALSVP